MTTITQDNAAFPQAADWVVHDHDLAYSWFHDIDTVPTLLRVVDGEPTERLEGWKRDDWEAFTGIDDLGADLPDWRPGCGSLSVDPNRTDELAVRFSGSTIAAGGSRSPPSKTSGRPSTTGTGPTACPSFPHRSPRPSDARGHHSRPRRDRGRRATGPRRRDR